MEKEKKKLEGYTTNFKVFIAGFEPTILEKFHQLAG
jgi:hypothetical protein